MAINTTVNRITYAGNDSTTLFSFPYYFLADGDLVVIITDDVTGAETTQVITTDYTVAGAGDENGGSITMVVAPATGETLVIYRDPSITQGLDLVENDPAPAEEMEKAWDRAAMVSQRLDEKTNRTIGLSDGFVDSFDTTLPSDLATPEATIKVNATGDGFDLGPTTTDIEDAEANAIAAAASASAAAASETAAAASAVDAADAAARQGLKFVLDITSGASPVTITESNAGYLYNIDASGGNVLLNLPTISGLTLTYGFNVGFKRTDSSANTVTIDAGGSDTIDGGGTKTIPREDEGFMLIANSSGDWASLYHVPDSISGDFVGTTDNQTLENKTFDDEITLQEIATPSTPASGYKKIYPKTDNKLYTLNDAGEEVEVGSGSGQGSINFVLNSDFEQNVDDVTVTANITKAHETASPGRATGSLKLTIDTLATTADYADIECDDIHNADIAGRLYVSFDYKTDANYSTDDCQFVLRNTDSSSDAIIYGANGSGKLGASTDWTKFTGVCYLDPTDNSYDLRMNVLSAPGTDSNIYIDNVKVGPDVIAQAPIVSDWIDFTPTGSWTTNTTYAGQYRRVGDSAEIRYQLSMAGAPNSASLSFDMISGLTVDTTKFDLRGAGYCEFVESGIREWVGAVQYAGSTFNVTHTESGNAGSVNQANPFTWGSGDLLVAHVTVAVEEWANSSATLSTSEMLNEVPSTSTNEATPTGTLSGAWNKMTFGTVDNDDLGLYDTSTGVWTANRTGEVSVSAYAELSCTSSNGTGGVRIKNTTTGDSVYGISNTPTTTRAYPNGSGKLEVNKGDTLEVQSYASYTSPTFSSGFTGCGFNITYNPDFSVYSVYGETEVVSSHSDLTNYLITAGTWGDLTSIDLTPGEWDIAINGVFYSNGATTTAAVELGFSEDTGTSFTDKAYADNTIFTYKDTSTFTGNPLSLNYQGLNITSDTTINLKAKAATSITNLQVAYKISARRVK